MLSDEQLKKLPELFQQIVELDRQITEAVENDVITLQELRPLIQRKAKLYQVAKQQYGNTVKQK